MDYSQNQSQLSIDNSDQDFRILSLQELIEKNIEIEQQIESSSFGESLEAIDHIIQRADEIIKGQEDRRVHSTELVLDTELLSRNHKVVGKAIQYNTNITDRIVQNAINQLVFKENEEDWESVCALAVQFGNPHFTSDSMLPFIDVAPKEHIPKQRTQRKQKSQVEEKRPKKSDKLERKDEGSASVNNALRQIKHLYREANEPIPYFKLICNPNNFMETVQNALQVSFLVKENMIGIKNGSDDGLPLVYVVDNHKALADKDPSQAICSLDVSFCEKMINHYKIQEPMLKRLNDS
ncbi:EP300-interacting inhibitor of differentiation 3 [Drosophila serrata]|uniref:EP300-interacting inhibitor of differentiation 3 n=1 Tax=Drosophila serrata TaxID=7274 RepID=UPI000A1D1F36|nr:EP300-interacting inhibitor of differentiation 3 [Drosophila serrata]KAH8389447.1 hypothetical protein KR200_003264 [Drosophila serrata]